jgi:hypothetical protein
VSEETSHRPLTPPIAAASWQRLLPSWPWIVGFAAMLRALASPLALLHDPDTYMHIAAGRWMLAHHALPTADPFSYTMAGAPWHPSEWLGEVVLAIIYGASGWGGVIVLTAACFGAAIGLLTWFLIRRVEALPAVIGALAGAMLVLPHLLARPHVLALPLLVLWCGALLAARADQRGPPLALLPVMALWANIHASFLFGIALAGFLGGEAALYPATGTASAAELRRWGLFVVAAVIASLVNANGIIALIQPFRLMTMPALQSGFGEWRAANFGEFPALAVWLVGAMALIALGWRGLRWTRVALLVALAYMACAHVRHADLLGLVGPLTIAASLGPCLAVFTRSAASSPLMRAAAQLARPASLPGRVLMLALGLAVGLPVLLRPIDRAGDAVTPEAALGTARQMDLTGPVFNSEAFGGYLIFTGVPTFIDGRVELYGNDFLASYLAAEQGDAEMLAALLDRYHADWAVLQAQSPIVAAFAQLPGWRRVYADDRAVIDVRN